MNHQAIPISDDELRQLRESRDELLAALTTILRMAHHAAANGPSEYLGALDTIEQDCRAAIAKATS